MTERNIEHGPITGGDDGGKSTNQHERPRGPHGEDEGPFNVMGLPGAKYVNEFDRQAELGYRLVDHEDVTPWSPTDPRQRMKLRRGSRAPEY